MVRYHVSQLTWWAVGAICVPVVIAATALGLIAAGAMNSQDSGMVTWAIASVLCLMLSAVAYIAEPSFDDPMLQEKPLREAVTGHKRAKILVIALLGAGGLAPSIALFLTGEVSILLAVIVVPVALLVLRFPHVDRFIASLDVRLGPVASSREADEG